MRMRVAITRAQPDANRTAHRVRALGAEPVLAALIEIMPRDFDPETTGAQALAFTSANGVRAYAQASAFRDVTAYCVGAATADAATRAGFSNVVSADGDVSALTKLILQKASPQNGKILHISGADQAGDLAGSLRAAGYDAERRIAYKAESVKTAPAAFGETLDVVLFHSARAAKIFRLLGAPGAENLVAACLSPAVAQQAKGEIEGEINKNSRIVAWKRVIVAPRPREDALLATALSSQGASA